MLSVLLAWRGKPAPTGCFRVVLVPRPAASGRGYGLVGHPGSLSSAGTLALLH